MKRKTSRRGTSEHKYPSNRPMIVALGIVFMVAIHVFVLGGFGVPREPVDAPFSEAVSFIDVEAVEAPVYGYKSNVKSSRVREAYDYPLFAEYYPGDTSRGHEEKAVQEVLKPAHRYSLKNTGSKKARIAIIIDDVGMNRTQSRAVVEMDDVPLTLAFLPYAPNLSALTEPARKAGHELMIHMPMEPMDGNIDTGPIALKDDMSADEIRAMMDRAFASFDGYVGLNNHMGSRLTQNQAAMDLVMDILDERGLFYVDSKTISTSVAANAARAQGLDYAERDVFLDHEETLEFAREALRKLEQVALDKGHAIAIGHPKANTVAALKEWVPTLAARGFEIVPVSGLLMHADGGENIISPVLVAEAEPAEEVSPKLVKKSKASVKKKKKPEVVTAPSFILDGPVEVDAAEEVSRIEPAAGDVKEETDVEVKSIASEALLSAPVGINEEAASTGGLYSLSE